jgi:hypothetical protein
MTLQRNASVLWTSAQLMSWPERTSLFLVTVGVIAMLIGYVFWGAGIGAHVGAKGWLCGQTPRGAPYCVRADGPR